MQSELFFSQKIPQAAPASVRNENTRGAKIAGLSNCNAVDRGDASRDESFASTLQDISGQKKQATSTVQSQAKPQPDEAGSKIHPANVTQDDIDHSAEAFTSDFGDPLADHGREVSEMSFTGLPELLDLSIVGSTAASGGQMDPLMAVLNQLLAIIETTADNSSSASPVDFLQIKPLIANVFKQLGQPGDKVFADQRSQHFYQQQLLALLQSDANLRNGNVTDLNHPRAFAEKDNVKDALAKLLANALGNRSATGQIVAETAQSHSWKAAMSNGADLPETDSGLMEPKKTVLGSSTLNSPAVMENAADGGNIVTPSVTGVSSQPSVSDENLKAQTRSAHPGMGSHDTVAHKGSGGTTDQSVVLEAGGRMTLTADEDRVSSDLFPKGQHQSKGHTALNVNSESPMAADKSSVSPAGDERFVKFIDASQIAKTTESNVGAAAGNDSHQKISIIDTDAKDNSWLLAQSHVSDKNADATPAVKEPGVHTSLLRSGPLEQMVQKAVFHLKNGHNEVQIDLKPDFLGHVRMQIATENHQVTVRIFAESPMVKELIENNLHQLKADLQQQGLEIDELEVSMNDDADFYGATQHKSGRAKSSKGGVSKESVDTASVEGLRQGASEGTHLNQKGAVDYFA